MSVQISMLALADSETQNLFFLLNFAELSASDQNIETAGIPVRTYFHHLTVDRTGKIMCKQ